MDMERAFMSPWLKDLADKDIFSLIVWLKTLDQGIIKTFRRVETSCEGMVGVLVNAHTRLYTSSNCAYLRSYDQLEMEAENILNQFKDLPWSNWRLTCLTTMVESSDCCRLC